MTPADLPPAEPAPAAALEEMLRTARAQLRGGQVHAAVETLRAAEPAYPEAAIVPRTLGEVYASCGQGVGAVECFERALRITPGDEDLSALLAVAHVVAQDLEAAREVCARAIERSPDHAGLHGALGLVEQTAGDEQAAIASFRRAVDLDPVRQSLSAYRLTRLGLDVDLDATEDLLCSLPNDAPEESWRALHFACAETAARNDQPARAFEHMLAGNRHSDFGVYDAELEVARATAIVTTFDRAFFEQRRDVGHRGVRPVFIVSLPRSGTSLLEQMLDSHPAFDGRGEDRFFGRLLGRLQCGVGENPANFGKFHRLSTATWKELGEKYMEGRTRRTVDKAMSLDEALAAIACALPEARVIHLQRDRRDVALSNLMTNFGPFTCPHATSPASTVLHVERHEALMQHWKRVLPLPILDMRYEDLVQDPEAELRRVLEFLEEDFSAEVLDFHSNERTVYTASLLQVRKPLNKQGLAKWRKYERELRTILPADWFEDVDGRALSA